MNPVSTTSKNTTKNEELKLKQSAATVELASKETQKSSQEDFGKESEPVPQSNSNFGELL